MTSPILVINPNSTQSVTDGIAAALAPFARSDGPGIECATLSEGPPGIESQADVEAVVAPLSALVRARPEAGAFVNACFSDPGLAEMRAATQRPVFGIGESAYVTALTLGRRFGVIAILPASVERHLRAIAAHGLAERCAGDRPLGLGIAELADATRCRERLLEVGRELRDQDGADVLILGCAGLASHRAHLEERLGLPVIEPCQAALALALGRVLPGEGRAA